jgi:catecholate siderophore receptor
LHNTAGITFLAAEGGEEDIRLRGFSLAGTGDIFADGIRDPAFYDRDTFNLDRVEVLRGSASMLFGRGSTGGAVNQVNKLPRTMTDAHEVSATARLAQLPPDPGRFQPAHRRGCRAAHQHHGHPGRQQRLGQQHRQERGGRRLPVRHRHRGRVPGQPVLPRQPQRHELRPAMGPLPRARTQAANTLISGLDPSAYFGMASDYNDGHGPKMATAGPYAPVPGRRRTEDPAAGGPVRARPARGHGPTGGGVCPGGPGRQPGPVRSQHGVHPWHQLKIQDMDTVHLQSDYSRKFEGLGFKHELLTGIDIASEKKKVYQARSAAQGGVNLTKPTTTAGTPDDGAWIDESLRVLRLGNAFQSVGWGAYAQDLVQVAPHWKLLGGLRYDSLRGDYTTYTIPNNAAGPTTTTAYQQNIGAWSKRLGALYQPNDLDSYHFSYGTSFNTSGDTYSYNAQSANTPPESSVNLELGAKLDSADKRFTTRLALFRSTKMNERNTDPDTAATRLLLSGQRHSAGFEVDFSGRLTPRGKSTAPTCGCRSPVSTRRHPRRTPWVIGWVTAPA